MADRDLIHRWLTEAELQQLLEAAEQRGAQRMLEYATREIRARCQRTFSEPCVRLKECEVCYVARWLEEGPQ